MGALAKWDIVVIWCKDQNQPHDKICICLCPKRHWFYYVNSDLPYSRKAKKVALQVTRAEIHCLTHDSFIDTTSITKLYPEDVVAALAEEKRHKGCISPTLKAKIITTARSHGVLTPDELAVVEGGET